MIRRAISEVSACHGAASDVVVELSIPNGEALAQRTLNPRLGIVGGLSILGTTGIVVPYSCAAWIDSIRRGIDVASAMGIVHIAGSTGKTSEAAIQALHKLPDVALIDMGDFVGGMLKYLRTHPVPRVTVAGGVAKMTKLAQGRLDLHSKRGEADLTALSELARRQGATDQVVGRIARANTVAEAFDAAADVGLGDAIAVGAWEVAARVLVRAEIQLETVVFDRSGRLAGRAPFAVVHDRLPDRKRR
jgi:cobalt-precorrin-5B (C1)-methyltransferase